MTHAHQPPAGHPQGHPAAAGNILTPRLHLVAWEITRSCNLRCAHCRASAEDGPYEGELSNAECKTLIDQIKEVGSPILILTGGEPLSRPDVFDIARYGVSQGLRVVMGTNGTLVTPEIAREMAEVPISRIAISLDFPTAGLQDKFRGEQGAFEAALAGIKNAQAAGVEIQINSTITKMNAHLIDDLVNLALEVNAASFHPFLLVPTGRGADLSDVELTPEEYEQTLNVIYDKQQALAGRMTFKPTDVPHYMRVTRQRQAAAKTAGAAPAGAMERMTRGCLAGTGFCFVSHTGIVQGCGYLTVPAGDVRQQTFGQIWNGSSLFNDLRNLDNIKGKCGVCEYKRICGGCRARAYEETGDYLEAEPYCVYQPQACLSVDVD
jgi:heme b synthase